MTTHKGNNMKQKNKKDKKNKQENSQENLQQTIEELQDKALRAQAEMENLRKRTSREVQEARIYGITAFAKTMLEVNDNLKRAIDAVPDHKRKEGSDEFKALIEGVEMTERLMLKAFETNGIKPLDPLGEKFDPNFHQAMFEIENKTLPNNSIAEVIQNGYIIGERVLRPAMVAVAKGGTEIKDGIKDEMKNENNENN